MQITGSFPVPAPKGRVWAALNDPDILRQCIPGCEELTRVSDTEFAGRVVARVGPVKATFTGQVTLADLDPPNGYTIQGEGKGGVAGFAKGSAKVSLRDEGAGTVLDYTVDASVGGKLAQIGGRLIESAAGQMAQEFFGKFAAVVGGPPAEAVPARAPAPAAAPKAPGGIPAWLWLIGAAAVVVIGILLLMR